MNANASPKLKNPDSVYVLISSSFHAKKHFAGLLEEALRGKKIDHGYNDKILKYTIVCIVEPRPLPPTAAAAAGSVSCSGSGSGSGSAEGETGSGECEEAALLVYIDVEAWKEVQDLRAYCNILERYVSTAARPEDEKDGESGRGPRVHFVLSSVRERISAKKLEQWTMEQYEDLIGDLVTRYHFDLIELSSEVDAAQYVSEIAEAYSELRERKKADKQKKVLSVASKGIKGSKGSESKLLITWMAGLACIPGISEHKARAIAKEYPTLRSLMDKYLEPDEDGKDKDKVKEKEELLTGIKYTGTHEDKGNKIGKTLSKRVFRYFTTTDPNEILN
jgi:hypothetical protein